MISVFLYPFDEQTEIGELFSEKRKAELEGIRNENVIREKRAVWRLLEQAALFQFHADPKKAEFRKLESGKWITDSYFFSLSHTDHFACVCLSDAPCGVDIEEGSGRISRFGSRVRSMMKLTLTKEELERFQAEPLTEREQMDRFLRAWTKKESMFKYSNLPYFEPSEMPFADYPVHEGRSDLGEALYLAYTADAEEDPLYYIYDGTGFSLKPGKGDRL